MSRYGMPSRKMLTFLNENPGSTAREISEHLFEGRTVEQVFVQFRYRSSNVDDNLRSSWQPKRYVLDSMMNSEWYQDVEILEERIQQVSKVCRGKWAYLTSPYCSRTLASDPLGTRPHPGCANRNAQRKWFWRKKFDGKYRYFLTTHGLGAIPEHGV